MYECDDGECIMAWPCDGTNDCTDGSDENGCGTLSYITVQSLYRVDRIVSLVNNIICARKQWYFIHNVFFLKRKLYTLFFFETLRDIALGTEIK